MKRNISDLLDSYFDEEVDLDSGTPLSASRIKELTMSKITHTKSHKLRTPVRVLIAAAAVAALSVSALAANYVFGAGELLHGFFAKGGENLTSGQVELMNEMGKTFEGGVTSNGATMTPIAALADENVYYLRLRIEAPEGVVLPALDEDVDGYYQLFGDKPGERMNFDLSAYESYGWSVQLNWLPDSDPTDNVKEVVLLFDAQSGTDLNFNDGVSKPLTIYGLWVQSPYKEYTPVFTGEFTFDIGLHYESKMVTLDCGGAAYEDPIYGYTNYLDLMTLSPLSISFQFRSNLLPDNPVIAPGAPGYIEIVMKDGTKIFEAENEENRRWNELEGMDSRFDPSTMIGDTPDWSTSNKILFDEPLDLTQVDYVQYGAYKFPVVIE